MNVSLEQFRRSESGTAAVEFALIAMAALTLFLGIIEVGRGLYMRNEMSFAVDLAAREILTNPAAADDEIETILRATVGFGAPAKLEVSIGSETIEGIFFRILTVRYPVTLLIPNLTNSSFVLSVERRIPVA